MNKTVITLILGLSLALTGFAQKSPKGSPSVRKSPESNPIVADDRDQVVTSKSKPSKLDSTRTDSGPTIIKAKPKPSQLVAALDTNKDGKLSFKEIEAAVEILKKLDTNKNGELTLNEFGTLPEAKKQSRGSIGNLGETKPNLSVRPNGRPSARPSARRISKSSSTTTRAADSKNTSPRKTRPSRRPSRLITKKIPGATALTDARATGAVETATGNQKRTVRTAPARKKSKSASRRRPTIKPAVSQNSAKLKLLVKKAKSLTQKIEQSMEGIKNPGKSRAAAIWVSKDSKELISSLEEELKKGREIDSNILLNAEKKLINTEKLLE